MQRERLPTYFTVTQAAERDRLGVPAVYYVNFELIKGCGAPPENSIPVSVEIINH